MKCPSCQATEWRVIKTRFICLVIRRIRECQCCKSRYFTDETIFRKLKRVFRKGH